MSKVPRQNIPGEPKVVPEGVKKSPSADPKKRPTSYTAATTYKK